MDALTAKVCNICDWVYSQPLCPRCSNNDYVSIKDMRTVINHLNMDKLLTIRKQEGEDCLSVIK